MNFKNLILIIVIFFTTSVALAEEVFDTDVQSLEGAHKVNKLSNFFGIKKSNNEGNKKISKRLSKKSNSQETIYKASDIEIFSNTMEYIPERNEIEANGNARVVIPENNSTLYADKIVYNHDLNKLKAFDNVKIVKNDQIINGDYVEIDLNFGNAMIDKPVTNTFQLLITAERGKVYDDRAEAYDGLAVIKTEKNIELNSPSFQYFFPLDGVEKYKKYYPKKVSKNPYHMDAKTIIINSTDDNDMITLKNADIYLGKVKLGSASVLKFATDKEQEYVETNLPEIGSIQYLGAFFGPGYVFNTPGSSTLKLAPLLNVNDNKFGIGAFARFNHALNRTEFGYGTAKGDFLLRGRQKIGEDISLRYGLNSYAGEWFLGDRISKYALQLDHTKVYDMEDLGLNFENRFYGGYVSERDSDWGTLRFRWMTQTRKPLFEYENIDKERAFSLSAVAQTMMGIYGTGDTQSLVRLGPQVMTRYKGWTQRVTYYQSATAGDSPMIFDKYVYGKCNLDLVESFRINQYLSVAYRASLALLKDSYNGDLLQENAFLISLGPDYAKFSLGYDTVRQRTLFNYAMLVGGENNDVKFDKLISYNPDKIAKKKEKQPKIWDNLGESLKNWGKKVPQDTDSMDEEEDITQNDIL